ncbi:hypothetical protein BGZ83_002256 [Gryganskiella cystojenkinii]|nr:hypothetical protein BGZ83_002256 [Gryganskiella cystojenkinii]
MSMVADALYKDESTDECQMDYEVEQQPSLAVIENTTSSSSTFATSSVSTFQPQQHLDPIHQTSESDTLPSSCTPHPLDITMAEEDLIIDLESAIDPSTPSAAEDDDNEADDEQEGCPYQEIPTTESTANSRQQPPLSSPAAPPRTPLAHNNNHTHHHHYENKVAHLHVDTSVVTIHPPTPDRSASSMTAITPITTPFTPDTTVSTPSTARGMTAPSSRRSSIRTATATLPRSELQEETIKLFKQFRNLIPCAKCFCRNTIQRDGMSDGNLRFKCRPPVSMSLICNKSYSESKIRNMIYGVVNGPSDPAETSTSASSSNGPSSANVLAMAPPPTMKGGGGRRTSNKNSDTNSSLRQLKEEQAHDSNQDDGYDEMNISADHRNSSAQHRRLSDESPGMDYDGAAMPPPSHPIQGHDSFQARDDARHYHPNGPVGLKQTQKLHYSHSHPNIGQQRRQHEQQQHHVGYSAQNQHYQSQQQQQQRQLQRQILRRESTQYQGSAHSLSSSSSRPEIERRFSHPATLQSHGSSNRYLPVNQIDGGPLSPALSSSSRSSPGRDQGQVHGGSEPSNTPTLRALPHGRYDDLNSSSHFNERRMSQPQPSGHHHRPSPYPTSSGTSISYYDRRPSEAEDYNTHQHREKYERLNANTLYSNNGGRYPRTKQQERSPLIPHSALASSRAPPHPLDTPSHSTHTSPQIHDPPSSTFKSQTSGGTLSDLKSEPMRFSHSMPVHHGGSGDTSRHAYQTLRDQRSSVYYHLPRRDGDDSHGPDQDMDADSRHSRHEYSRPGPYDHNKSSLQYSGSRDLDTAMPRNTIKLTCFPSATSTSPSSSTMFSSTRNLETEDAFAMQLSKSSKVVIEISQPRSLQSYRDHQEDSRPIHRLLRHTVSQPNMKQQEHQHQQALKRSATSSSIVGTRRSTSPDSMSFGSSKKRRADSLSGNGQDEDESSPTEAKAPLSSSILEPKDASNAVASVVAAQAAAAAVIAAAANATAAAAAAQGSPTSGESPFAGAKAGLQIVGVNYKSSSSSFLQVPRTTGSSTESPSSSPSIEALQVAQASSYVLLEDQKELGIDYSAFTRVETAGWRILIPPTVEASFRSEDFGLMLKPKVEVGVDPTIAMGNSIDETEPSEIVESEQHQESPSIEQVVKLQAEDPTDTEIESQENAHQELVQQEAMDFERGPSEEMDELEDD